MPTQWQAKHLGESEPPRPMPQVVWSILSSRGILSTEDVDNFLAPQLKSIAAPGSIDQLQLAVDRLIQAHTNGESIMVYGDFDLDGSSGLALTVEALRAMGFKEVSHYQPRRLSEGYGFHTHAVEQAHKNGVDLIVTVDVGITAIEATSKANELGVDVILTDHHLPKETLPEALAVLNPNKGFCSSELGHLCGAGVAFYLIMGLRKELANRGVVEAKQLNIKDLLDFFVIGTLTDMVPVVRENRVLVKHGLKVLEQTPRAGLQALLKELKMFGRPLTSQDVAIRFAPKLNALSRMDGEILPVDIFLEKDHGRAKQLVKQVMATNDQRVKSQRKAEMLAEEILKSKDQKGFVFVHSDQFHKGVVGLVATKLSQNYGVPAFVGSEAENGMVAGSARLPSEGFPSLLDALEHGSKHLTQFGGHAPAAGFEFKISEAENLEKAFADYYMKFYMGEIETSDEISYDVESSFADITPDFMKWFDTLQPFGTDFESPLFRFNEIQIKGVKELRGGHFRFDLWDTKVMTLRQGLWFSPPAQHEVLPLLDGQKPTVDILAEPQWNYFAGAKTLQLLIKDIRLSS
ncbi:MAG: single-stranded-DNA-specific exonuclease RecJ [Bdellovibrionaceae bacterium]|nr:single-stranded-DNA-specific exonuclease RecJ [Pseudobdellovibrionaceae bacterium]|tara:strand:+ start:15940 stop:17664 length:1725 start_codon:yes stop_codon:yes gene_type:complete